MPKELGIVTKEEMEVIRTLYRRKTALEELLPTIDLQNRADLYEHIIQDLAQTNTRFAEWWDTVSKKYGWSFAPTNKWRIEFESRIVSIEE